METLSNYVLSHPASPPITMIISLLPMSAALSEVDKKATNDFLDHLRAKVKTAEQSSNAQPPTESVAIVQYTWKLEDGFPVVHGYNSTHAFDNIGFE